MSDVSHSKRITLETYDSEWGRGKRGGGRDLKEGEKCGDIYTGDPEVSQASIDLSYYCRSLYTSADDIHVCRGTAWYLTDDQYRGDKGGVEAISIQTLAHTHLNICTSEMQNVNRPLPPSPPSSQHLRWPGVLLKRTLTFIVIIYLFSLFPWFKRLAFWDSLSVAAWAEYRSINK